MYGLTLKQQISARWNDQDEQAGFEPLPTPCASSERESSYMLPQLLAPAELAGGSVGGGFFGWLIAGRKSTP